MARNINRAQQSTYDALTPAQAAAIGYLLEGRTGKDTAAAVGVTEETVSRWRNTSPAFSAALNLARHELAAEQLDMMRRIRRRALEALADMLDDDDAGTRLKAVGMALRLDTGAPIGPTTPEQVKDAWADERRADLLGAVFHANLGEPGTLVFPFAGDTSTTPE